MKYILANDSSGQIEDWVQFKAENLTEARLIAADLLTKKDHPEAFGLYEKVDAEGRQLEITFSTTEGVQKLEPASDTFILVDVPVTTTKEKKKKPVAEAPTASEVIQDPVMLDAAQAAAETLVDEVK